MKALDPNDADYVEMLQRFENVKEVKTSKDTNELLEMFRSWQNRPSTTRQDILIRRYGDRLGITKIKALGISQRKRVSRKELKLRYQAVKYHTKKGTKLILRARNSKGRFVKIIPEKYR